jgi:two-component system NtrC family sensor kinase
MGKVPGGNLVELGFDLLDRTDQRPGDATKPAGEGTGLGLSISHDIIVKQHGGCIEVNTKPGEFTEFRIVLPRAAAFIAGGQA